MPLDGSIEKASAILKQARFVAILTGAGLSADSGLGTYRSEDSPLWTAENLDRFATPKGFRSHFVEAWSWYQARRRAMLAAKPNEGHIAIAKMEEKVPALAVITQNVDSLHRRAGSKNVLELHGSLDHAVCWACKAQSAWPETTEPSGLKCRSCGGPLRPDVVFFDEYLDPEKLLRATTAAEKCDVFISIGTSNMVDPAASLPWLCAKRNKPVILVNPDMTGQRRGETITALRGRAAEILPAIVRKAWPRYT